ncbi:hypothetical protein M422DRAFT_251597 [Sphaerobolus stellatus SS14]|uniref:DUF6534 domain-containing protein n=1 Tax=Sphaerobolus stellatus (strain SS14) TaxID=990650 RepID=A0A0C9VD93_SPHS4|nr:hypothetical protein M422DRAFT_251597 [Sphaerobolus stellatus SS14]
MQLQDLKHPTNAQVINATIYGPLLTALLISTFMYGVSLVSFSLLCRIPAVMSEHTVAPVNRFSILQVGGKERYECAESYNFVAHNLNDIRNRIYRSSTLRYLDCKYWKSGVDGSNPVAIPYREDMHVPTLPHSLLNYFSPAEFGQVNCSPVSKSLRSRVRLMAVPVILLGLLQMGAGLALVSIEVISKTFSSLRSRRSVLRKVIILQGAATAACDILISISLCYVLHSHRSGIKRTDSLINRMIIYAINRGIATSICALMGAFLYYFAPSTYYYVIPQLANAYLYVISAVSILTLREGLREEINQSFHLSDLYTDPSRSDATNGRQNDHSDFTEDKNHQTV